MITAEYRDQVIADIEAIKLPLELFEEKVHDTTSPDKSRIGKIVRLYITCKQLGGLLAVNHGDGWIPAFPEKENYPMKGKWFSPRVRTQYSSGIFPKLTASAGWEDAVCAALCPEKYYTYENNIDQNIAYTRAAKLRHPFRALAAVAILKSHQKEGTCK